MLVPNGKATIHIPTRFLFCANWTFRKKTMSPWLFFNCRTKVMETVMNFVQFENGVQEINKMYGLRPRYDQVYPELSGVGTDIEKERPLSMEEVRRALGRRYDNAQVGYMLIVLGLSSGDMSMSQRRTTESLLRSAAVCEKSLDHRTQSFINRKASEFSRSVDPNHGPRSLSKTVIAMNAQVSWRIIPKW